MAMKVCAVVLTARAVTRVWLVRCERVLAGTAARRGAEVDSDACSSPAFYLGAPQSVVESTAKLPGLT